MSAGSRIKTPFAAFSAGDGTPATPATGTLTVLETGVDQDRVTTIDIADLVLITTTAAAKADGKLLYTLPAGNILITRASISLGIEGTAALNVADTPDVGLGTVIATGAVATLDGTATFENILTGQTWAAACGGVRQQASVAATLTIAAAAAHTIHLNIADTWAGIDAGMKATGRVVIEWKYMD
jgi:hypothetical protein